MQKRISCSKTCVHCDVMAKTHMHILFVCAKVVNRWEVVQLNDIIRNSLCIANDFFTLLFEFFDRMTFKQQSSASPIIVQRAKHSLNEWRHMQQHKHHDQNVQHTTLWSKSSPSYMKCNIHCAIFYNNSVVGYDICLCLVCRTSPTTPSSSLRLKLGVFLRP